MVARTYSATLSGVNAVEIEIESHDGGGNPKMMIVGLPDASVKESRERVSAAIALVNTLPPEVAEALLIEAQGTLARERALAAENAQSSPQ
jgi:hypothetical protein